MVRANEVAAKLPHDVLIAKREEAVSIIEQMAAEMKALWRQRR